MKSIGLIVEYNPIHNGHIYQLEQIKNNFKDYTIIVVMNSFFSQRGEPIIIDKKTKIELMLKYGIDIIIENPTSFSSDSADIFAKSSLFLLNQFKIDTLVFGSETCNIKLLTDIANYELFSSEFNTKIKKYLNIGNSYKESYNKVIKNEFNIDKLDSNDILNLCYIKEIIKNKYDIKLYPIKRIYNNNSIKSASEIRELFYQNKINEISNYVPFEVYNYLIINNFNLDVYFNLLKYKIITCSNLNIYKGIDEGFENRIKKYIDKSSTYDELIHFLISKRYKINSVKRKLNNILLDIKKDEYMNNDYIKILGLSKKGKKYLNTIKKKIDLPIISKNEKGFPILDKEILIEKIYYLVTNNKNIINHTIIK